MPVKLVNIINKLDLFQARRRPADPPVKRDHQTAMTTLIGPDFQQPLVNNSVKPDPVKPVNLLIQMTRDSGHQGNRICFARAHRGYLCQGLLIIFRHHGLSFMMVREEQRAGQDWPGGGACEHHLPAACAAHQKRSRRCLCSARLLPAEQRNRRLAERD